MTGSQTGAAGWTICACPSANYIQMLPAANEMFKMMFLNLVEKVDDEFSGNQWVNDKIEPYAMLIITKIVKITATNDDSLCHSF